MVFSEILQRENWALPRRLLLAWLELPLHFCCLTQKPYWSFSITSHYDKSLEVNTYNSVAEGILMIRHCHKLAVCKMRTEFEWNINVRHVFTIWLTMTLSKSSHTTSTPSFQLGFISPTPWHAPKAGTDYSPVCLFWLWLLLHPDRLSSGLQCVQRLMGTGQPHYTWGLLPQSAKARARHVAPPDWPDAALILSTSL